MAGNFDLSGYVTVADRLAHFYKANPDGRIVCKRPKVVTIGERTFLEVTATVYRSPDDPKPTVASAWEPFPGRTPYTRDSEAMNAETSAVGRALGLAGYGSQRSIATLEEVSNRRQPQDVEKPQAKARVLAAAGGNADAAREAWQLVFPENPYSVYIERLEACEDVARKLAGEVSETEEPVDHSAGLAAARKVLEEVDK